jgi:hypothetical protein
MSAFTSSESLALLSLLIIKDVKKSLVSFLIVVVTIRIDFFSKAQEFLVGIDIWILFTCTYGRFI